MPLILAWPFAGQSDWMFDETRMVELATKPGEAGSFHSVGQRRQPRSVGKGSRIA